MPYSIKVPYAKGFGEIEKFNRFAIEDVDSLPPTLKLMLDPKVNRDMSIKAAEIIPDKIALVKKEVKPFVYKTNEEYGEEEDEGE